MGHRDPSGQYKEILAAVGGCAVGGAISYFSDISNHASGWATLCEAILGCVIGAVTGVLATSFPQYGGCIAGIGIALAHSVVPYVCNCQFPARLEDWLCEVMKSIVASALGCLAQTVLTGVAAEVFSDAIKRALIAVDLWIVGDVTVAACLNTTPMTAKLFKKVLG